jgi:hypothetical protein
MSTFCTDRMNRMEQWEHRLVVVVTEQGMELVMVR